MGLTRSDESTKGSRGGGGGLERGGAPDEEIAVCLWAASWLGVSPDARGAEAGSQQGWVGGVTLLGGTWERALRPDGKRRLIAGEILESERTVHFVEARA